MTLPYCGFRFEPRRRDTALPVTAEALPSRFCAVVFSAMRSDSTGGIGLWFRLLKGVRSPPSERELARPVRYSMMLHAG